jgi:hypothetical protein
MASALRWSVTCIRFVMRPPRKGRAEIAKTRFKRPESDVGAGLNLTPQSRHSLPGQITPINGVAAPSPQSIVTAVTLEEPFPLPLLIVGMALWGLGITAAVMVPLGCIALLGSPLIVASGIVQGRR